MGVKVLTNSKVFAILLVGSFCFVLCDDQNAWAEPGLRIVDQYAYPVVDSMFENNVTVNLVCTEQDDPRNRYTCAFANNKVKEIHKATSIVANLLHLDEKEETYSLIELENESVSGSIQQENCSKSMNETNDEPCKFVVLLQDRISIQSSKLTQIFEKTNIDSLKSMDTTYKIKNNLIPSETNEISQMWATMKKIFSIH